MKHYLLFDMGTGSSRVAIVDSAGSILGIKSYANKYYRDEAYDDALYFVPDEWERNLLAGCKELCGEHPDVRINAISAAAARQSFVLLDKKGKAFYGLPNIDNRGRQYMGEIQRKPEIYKVTGKWVTEDFGAAKLLGYRRVYPAKYSDIGKVLSLSEWIGHIFTGAFAMEYSMASETQLYDLYERSWSKDICGIYGVDPTILPDLLPSGAALPVVSGDLKNELHLADDAVFIIGGADTQTAARQTGIKQGEIAIVSGTTSPVVAMTDAAVYDKDERIWLDADLGGKSFLVEMNPGVTGMNYERAKDVFCKELSFADLDKRCQSKDAVRCIASFTSLLFYEKRSIRHGGFYMRSPFQENVDATDFIYAVLADIACGIYEELRRLIAFTGNDPQFILGCGGGFRTDALCRMVASLAQKPLVLKDGFSQATTQGLVSVLNVAMNEENHAAGKITKIEPEKDNLIVKYYGEWLEYREKLL